MESRKITISAPNGLHARPAGDLVKLVKSFEPSKITISTESRTVNAASMFSVLSLGLKKGVEINIAADGGEEAKAVQAIADFLANIQE